MSAYRSLHAWRLAHRLAIDVTRATAAFPRHERFELTSQLRRAALSVPTNLVEGRARFGGREYLRFVRIAAGSCAEVDYLLFFAHELAYIDDETYRTLNDLRHRTSCVIARLARGLERSLRPRSPVFVRVRPQRAAPRSP